MTLNKDWLDQWIRKGYAHIANDGAWAWTNMGKNRLDDYDRCLARNLLYGHNLSSLEMKHLFLSNPELIPDEWLKI